MCVLNDDISFVLSGGSSNINPNRSLGGEPSNRSIFGIKNNLFDDVLQTETSTGLVDYRCLYCFNDHPIDGIADVRIWTSDIPEGATIELGALYATDEQRVTIVGDVSGGSYSITYDGSPLTISYDADLNTWASNLETALNSLPELSGIVVTATDLPESNARFFQIEFTGFSDTRNHALIQLTSNDLTDDPEIHLTKIVEGGPVNAIAQEIELDIHEPFNVAFSEATQSSPLTVNYLGPEDGFPFWVRRTTTAGTEALENDGFSLFLVANPAPA